MIVTVFFFAICSSTCYTSVVGALSFWAPSFIRENLKLSIAYSSLGFSLCSLFTGIVGTACGGVLLDRIGGSAGKRGTSKALMLCFIFILFAFPVGIIGFFVTNIYGFFTLLTIAEFFVFGITSIINVVLLK